MKAKVLTENLLRSLTRLGRIISPKTQTPILQCIKIEAKKDGLYLTATNAETTETVWVGGKIEKEGELCVSSKVLMDFVSSLPPGTTSIELSEEILHVSCLGFKATIPTFLANEFPVSAVFDKEKATKINKKTLSLALLGIIFSSATDEGRPVLTGVKVRRVEDKTQFVATDGYRLSVKTIETEISGLTDLVIPAKALVEVSKIALEEKEEDEIYLGLIGSNQIGFVVGDTTIITRLIEGQYPNFERIIPKIYTTKIKTNKEQFLRAIKSAAIFARDNANIIRLSLMDGKILVTANAPQVGENKIEVEASIEGDGGEIAFNSKFLAECLMNLSSDEVIFEMTGSLNPGVFKPVGDDSYFHIIMPVRVQS